MATLKEYVPEWGRISHWFLTKRDTWTHKILFFVHAQDICIAAVKEKDIQAKLKAVIVDWNFRDLEFVDFKNKPGALLKSEHISEAISAMEDSLMVLSSLLSNRWTVCRVIVVIFSPAIVPIGYKYVQWCLTWGGGGRRKVADDTDLDSNGICSIIIVDESSVLDFWIGAQCCCRAKRLGLCFTPLQVQYPIQEADPILDSQVDQLHRNHWDLDASAEFVDLPGSCVCWWWYFKATAKGMERLLLVDCRVWIGNRKKPCKSDCFENVHAYPLPISTVLC